MVTASLLGRKVGGVRVVPLTLKILVVFVIFILVSNFSSNYLNLTLNRGELVRLMNALLVKELKEIYTFPSNQYDIYRFSGNLDEAVAAMESNAARELKGERSLALAVKGDGTVFLQSGGAERWAAFPDAAAIQSLSAARSANKVEEGPIFPVIEGREYFGVYKYNEKWDAFLMRLEEREEFYRPTRVIMYQIGAVIVVVSLLFAFLGVFIVRFILRFIGRITDALMRMQESQRLELIDLSEAPNDDVTYLGASFNSLSSSIDNLMTIFRSFVTQDVVQRAYREKEIRLEGTQKELTILFTDIKGFTNMTETLGNDIIALLNLHYDQAIRRIHEHYGIVGSIIGDALLSVYGTLTEGGSKSLEALLSAYEIQAVARSLRAAMTDRREVIEKERGHLTAAEEKVFKAVMLEIGVGIDGGQVFYGNIGSSERMTNTVIGDNVNSASRLEGLTRIYRVPTICSSYIAEEVKAETNRFVFVELDTVQVKGKTLGKRIFYPIDTETADAAEIERFGSYSKGLEAYYSGKWDEARTQFAASGVMAASVFLQRMEGRNPPADWNGVWTMETK
ncbi:MAG: hypothetical protein A2Y36_17400 [Treponema sp. GWA1_62_8]|nr:MAG: hypothetical protein A2Y36_17400 [Treponema sp. GWA1_62_8]